MIILDTNVISALMRAEPETAVVHWLDIQPASSVWITTITVMEVRFGLQTMPAGRRRELMKKSFDLMLENSIEGRIAPFDADAALHTADLMAMRKIRGRPVDVRDAMIAGIVVSTQATLATRNVSHFADLQTPVVNPWKA